jgi:ribosomal protein S18 acetylase RimI-like enzyme
MNELAAKFINGTDPAEAIPLFEHFATLPGNQYSYENTLVYEDETGICGMILAYDGAILDTLRAPFLDHIRSAYNYTINPENETGPGEYYIDCLSVFEAHQGKGIGKKLIKALLEKLSGMHCPAAGLLVSKNNAAAERLYTGLGFKIIGEKPLLGEVYWHMQYVFNSLL